MNLGRLLDLMKKDDLLIITADHGNGPPADCHTVKGSLPGLLSLSEGGAEIPEQETFEKPLRW